VRIQFPDVSGRYPSILDVMRDIHGITGGVVTTTTFLQSADHASARIISVSIQQSLWAPKGNAQSGVNRRFSSLYPIAPTRPLPKSGNVRAPGRRPNEKPTVEGQRLTRRRAYVR
jgi:hypothetical protein